MAQVLIKSFQRHVAFLTFGRWQTCSIVRQATRDKNNQAHVIDALSVNCICKTAPLNKTTNVPALPMRRRGEVNIKTNKFFDCSLLVVTLKVDTIT